MITRYVIAETERSARAALDLYLSLSEGDRAHSERVHTTERRAQEAMSRLRTGHERDRHDRVWARACVVWRLTVANGRRDRCST